jgi:hypothetical protein
MVDELRAQGTELMLSPYIHSVEGTSKNIKAARDQGLLVSYDNGTAANIGWGKDEMDGGVYLYDVFNPKAREYLVSAVSGLQVQ